MSRERRTVADEPFLLVRTAVADHPGGHELGEHVHDWHQLVHVHSGLVAVHTAAGTWVAPPTWAVWIPAGTRHRLRFAVPSALRTLYVRADHDVRDCRAFAVSPLLRELLARTAALGMLDERDAVEAALTTLLLAESRGDGPPALTLPWPVDPRTRHAAELIAADPGRTTAALARAVGLGVRTLERRFSAETGTTVGRWRRLHLLLRGLETSAAGGTVADAARAAGYQSASAYVAAFRGALGTTPARYFTT